MSKFLLIAVVAAGVSCCDPKHDGYAVAADNAKICVAKGGIPITEPIVDDGQHTFQILRSCAFPCDQRLTVEK